MNPENENKYDDPFLRVVKWIEGDHSIQPNFDTIGGQVDVTNVIHDVTFNIDLLHYKQGFMPKKAFHDLPHDTTLTVVVWSEQENPGDNWDIYFRVVYWYTDISNQYVLAMTNPVQISNSESADQTHPAVTAYLTQYMPMSIPWDCGVPQNNPRYAADIFPNLVVDIAYQWSRPGQYKQVRYQQYCATMNEWGGIPGFGPFVPAPAGEFLLPTPFSGIDGDYKHPDIVFYSFPGDEENGNCNALFAAYEFESLTGNPQNDFYAIVAVAGPVDASGTHWGLCVPWVVSIEPKTPQQGYPLIWPQYPRIDAGVESAIGGYTICGVVWQELIIDGAAVDIDSRLDILIIDMWFNGYPITWLEFGIHYDPAVYCAFPYIDIDPLEKYMVDDSDHQPPTPTGLPSYTNVVVTEGQNANNDTFKVGYWNSATGYVDEIYSPPGRRSGFATISMYALQSWEDDDYDFDVVFVSDHITENIYPVYSSKCRFLNNSWSLIYAEPPSQISDDGHESSWDEWVEPFEFGPVGAIFDWRNEEVAWTYKASGPFYLHHVYGDYDFYW